MYALDFGDDIAEHHLDTVAELRGFVFNSEGAVLLFFWELAIHGIVWPKYLLLEVCEPLVEGAVH